MSKQRSNFRVLLLGMTLVLVCFTHSVPAAANGENIFKGTCSACHKIGGGKLVGPDLKGATKRHDQEWLLKWIKSSQTLIQSGDEAAQKLFADNNNVIMPDNNFTEEEIKGVIDYIKAQSEAAPVAAAPAAVPSADGQVADEPAFNLGLNNPVMLVMLMLVIVLFAVVLMQSSTIRRLSAGSGNKNR